MTTTGNPVSTDSFGNLTFYADPGNYDCATASGGNFLAPVHADSLENSSTYASLAMQLLDWALTQSFRLVSATRDGNGAVTTASVVWPDGATGTFTTDAASTAFPGAIDAYHVTHVLTAVTQTVTQTAVTRDTNGAVIAQPALTVA